MRSEEWVGECRDGRERQGRGNEGRRKEIARGWEWKVGGREGCRKGGREGYREVKERGDKRDWRGGRWTDGGSGRKDGRRKYDSMTESTVCI